MTSSISGALARKRTALSDKDRGFTLIELLVVVLIIGVLAAIAIPIFLNQQDGAKDKAVAASVTNAKTAVAAALTSGSISTDTLIEIKPLLVAGTLSGYTKSADIPVGMVVADDGKSFVITAWWGTDAAANGTNHGYSISESSAAIKLSTPAPVG
jgi:prepilin-type N-terminal cleavage/methylation domain-containing protein